MVSYLLFVADDELLAACACKCECECVSVRVRECESVRV